jgi:hypothetical protein
MLAVCRAFVVVVEQLAETTLVLVLNNAIELINPLRYANNVLMNLVLCPDVKRLGHVQ